jgi:hypothetical protein
MKRLTLFLTACVVAVLAILATNIRAQSPDTNDRTFMTFNTRVELPGVTLEPGEYEFRLAPMSDSRDVVQVLKKDDSKVIGQWTFVQAQRPRATDDTVVMFKEAPEGGVPAVQYWYYPGRTVGKEFIYPKDQAQRIATRTGTTVQTEAGPLAPSEATASADTSITPAPSSASSQTERPSGAADRSLANGSVAAQPSAAAGSLTGNRGIPQTEASAAQSTDKPSASASAETTQRNAPAAVQPSDNRDAVGTSGFPNADQADRPVGTSGRAQTQATPPAAQPASSQPAPAKELPQTASPLPMSALVGFLSLVAALSTRALRA